MFFKIGVLKSFVIFTGNHLRSRLLFNKVAGLRSAMFIKKELQHRYCEIFKNSFFCRTPPVTALAFLMNKFSLLI